MGKGHEVLSRLGGELKTTLEFGNIENIHEMRKRYECQCCMFMFMFVFVCVSVRLCALHAVYTAHS